MLQERRDNRGHWLGEDVHEIDVPLGTLTDYLPTFFRVPFGAHRKKDVIMRRRESKQVDALPVGVVSKSYALIQHADIVRELARAIEQRDFDPAPLRAHLTMTESGTRMSLRAVLPDTLALDPPDGHRMALTFECFNSVDGSVPLFALVGWFRFVCRNGLVVGTTCARVRRRHIGSLTLDTLASMLEAGLTAADQERETFAEWSSKGVGGDRLAAWVDGTVAESWGPMAAARVYGVICHGWDGTPVRSRMRRLPHELPVPRETAVPGSTPQRRTAYAAAQALAWVASRRPNVAEREKWRGQIAEMMKSLLAA